MEDHEHGHEDGQDHHEEAEDGLGDEQANATEG